MLSNLITRLKSRSGGQKPEDGRSRRFVAMIDCMLNQNARDLGAARFPAMNFDLLRLCHENHVGILQMPCPEIAALGFKRTRAPGQSIRAALDTVAGRHCCAETAVNVADRIAAQLADGNQLLAVLGGNQQSPGCAVHAGASGLGEDSGIFLQALQAELDKRCIAATFRGIRDADPALLAEDLAWFGELIGQPPSQT
jgi:predicted secreted protein